MPVIETKLDLRSETFSQNHAQMLETLEELDKLLAQAARGDADPARVLRIPDGVVDQVVQQQSQRIRVALDERQVLWQLHLHGEVIAAVSVVFP